MNRLLLILNMCGIITVVYSQSTLVWSRDFTTSISNYYSEYPSIQAFADTIKVIGRKNTVNGQRLFIVKYDLRGATISTKSFGDSVSNNSIIDYKFDNANCVYILQKELLGFYKSRIVLQKYSLDGALIWREQIQNPGDTSYNPRSLGLANDTCLFISAYREYGYPKPGDDVLFTTTFAQLYAYNSSGNKLWLREFNPSTEIKWFAYDIFVRNNTAFLFANNAGLGLDNRLVKVDINNILSINTNTGLINGVNEVQLTPDSNLLIIAGTPYRISKVNLNGSLIWTKQFETYLPSNSTGDEIKSTFQDANGDIYVTGRHYGSNLGTASFTNADILTLKYDDHGNLLWQNRYTYLVDNADIGNTIVKKNGYIYVGGQSENKGVGTGYDYVALKMNSSSGVRTGVYRYDGAVNGDDAVSSLLVFDNGNVALTGLSYKNAQYDWTTQLLSDIIVSSQNISPENKIQVYPNPISTGENLTLVGKNIKTYSIISFIGQVVQHGKVGINAFHSIQLDNLSTGMYLLYITTGKEIITKKIIVR